MEAILGLSGMAVAGLVFLLYAGFFVMSIMAVAFVVYHVGNCIFKSASRKDSFGKCLFGPCIPG